MANSIISEMPLEIRKACSVMAAICGNLGVKFGVLRSKDPAVFSCCIEQSREPLSEQQLRIFARYFSIGTGRSVELSSNDGRAVRVESVPANIAIYSTSGQLSNLGAFGSGVQFAATRLLSMTAATASVHDSVLVETAKRCGFNLAEISRDGGVPALRLQEAEGVFGEPRFCNLLSELGQLNAKISLILGTSKSALSRAATECGGALLPGTSSKGETFVDLAAESGCLDRMKFFSATGLLPNVVGRVASRHAVLRDFVAHELEDVRYLVRTWWVEGDRFHVHLRGDSYNPGDLNCLREPLSRLNYQLSVDSGPTRGRGVVAVPAAEQLFVGTVDWEAVLPRVVHQHVGLECQLKTPGVDGYQGAPRLLIYGCQREYSAVVHRAAATISESMIPYPIEVICRDREGSPGIVATELDKLVCIGAPRSLFVHYSGVSTSPIGGRAILASVIGASDVSLERVFGDRLNVEFGVFRVGLGAHRLLIEEDKQSDASIDGGGALQREIGKIRRVSANLLNREVVCLVLGETSPGLYKVFLPAVSGMGLLSHASGMLNSGWTRGKVTGFSASLKCPIISLNGTSH